MNRFRIRRITWRTGYDAAVRDGKWKPDSKTIETGAVVVRNA